MCCVFSLCNLEGWRISLRHKLWQDLWPAGGLGVEVHAEAGAAELNSRLLLARRGTPSAAAARPSAARAAAPKDTSE